MLKIKDNVDLRELEKFGFKYYANTKSCYYGCCDIREEDKNVSYFINNAKTIIISPHTAKTMIDGMDTLYDLIEAGLVEKVEG